MEAVLVLVGNLGEGFSLLTSLNLAGFLVCMDLREQYKELLARRSKYLKKIDDLKKNLSHPHGDWQSGHDLAESDHKVYLALLEETEEEIRDLERKLGPEVYKV